MKIEAVSVSGVTPFQATIRWSTNNPSDSAVGIATSPSTAYSFTACCGANQTTAHSVSVTGLSAATTYNFVVQSWDGTTRAESSPDRFTTTASAASERGGDRIPLPAGPVHAFPEAQGGGAASAGGSGRAGGAPQVYEVVNLDDQGGSCSDRKCAGSLRFCLEASGPRTCVFRVSGLISPQSRLAVYNPYVTVAGQTAPGGGIVLGGPNQHGEVIFISTHDVIMRYLTYDGNNPNTPTGPNTGTVGFEIASGQGYNIVLDHISARWWGNKTFAQLSNDAGNDHNLTYQWILAYEPNVGHPVGVGTDATSGSSLQTTDIDWHHSMFVNISHRLPMINTHSVRWVNNLIYNWNRFGALSWGGAQVDYIGNKYVDGNLSQERVHPFNANGLQNDPSDQSDNCPPPLPCDNPGPPGLYLLNNVGRSTPKPGSQPIGATNVVNDAGQIAMTHQGWEGGDRLGPMPSNWFRNMPLPAEEFPIVADSVDRLDDVLLSTIGNSQHLDCDGHWVANRDAMDARLIDQYQNRGRGGYFTGQFSPPPIAKGTACLSSQHDGIPDAWKTAHHYKLSDGELWSRKASNGYTYLENYLNGTDPAQ
jgi:hypothetical protein